MYKGLLGRLLCEEGSDHSGSSMSMAETQNFLYLLIANDWCQIVNTHQEGELIQNVNGNTCNSPVKCLDLKTSIIKCHKKQTQNVCLYVDRRFW